MNEPGRISLHKLNRSIQSIRHIHHIHKSPLLDRADELLSANGRIIDIHGIIGSTATRKSNIGNEPRETNRSGIDSILMEIIVAQKFRGHLGHSIDGLRTLNGILRSAHMRGRRSERTDGTRGKDRTTVLSGNFQHIPQSVNAYFPCELRL